MSYQRYSKEFKQEAVKQVTERGHSVSDVSKRLDVSANSLYAWVSASKGSKGKSTLGAMDSMRRENARLKSELYLIVARKGGRIKPGPTSSVTLRSSATESGVTATSGN